MNPFLPPKKLFLVEESGRDPELIRGKDWLAVVGLILEDDRDEAVSFDVLADGSVWVQDGDRIVAVRPIDDESPAARR